MNPLRVDFNELYDRHLRRHSEFGLNVGHFVGVVGIYFCLGGLAYVLTESIPIVAAVTGVYLLVLAANVPWRLMLAVTACVAAVLAAAIGFPLPWWAYVVAIVLLHRSQVWSHHVWRRDLGMDRFAAKYRKGAVLSFLLALYELPILLNFLLVDRGRRVVGESSTAGDRSDRHAAARGKAAVVRADAAPVEVPT